MMEAGKVGIRRILEEQRKALEKI